ncbi:YidC/Oxa1 family insertase periplasmic domain-containing protein, partial [Xylella fastidiosa subsp. multiplex]|uniref:YidC/Oxa1 family insertase periplasmic domain-containing protein n=1 Tax=Xylella fastidiosa TaxID=2371 RepID=UPI0020C1F8F8
INVTTDVLQLKLDGFSILAADLLRVPQSKDRGAKPIKLLTDDPNYPSSATTGWVSQSNSPVPNLSTFRPEQSGVSYKLANDQDRLVVPFVWTAANGVS